MKHKVCTKCNEKKTVDCFYRDYGIKTKISYLSKCKDCMIKLQRERKICEKNPLITSKKCKDCDNNLSVDNFYKSTRHKDGYFTRCKDCHKSKERTGYVIKRTKEYMKEYNKKRYAKPNYIIRQSVRKSLSYYAKHNKNKQYSSKFLGCTIEFFKGWIEYQFDENMSWKNHGDYWHFDHVKPCASFDLTDKEEILKCYNWSNYRPIEGKENIEKSDKIIPNIIESHKKLANKYLRKYKLGSAPTLKNQVN